MPAEGWTAVKTTPATHASADALVEELAASGLRLSKAQALSACLDVGIEEIRADHSRLLSRRARKRKKASSA